MAVQTSWPGVYIEEFAPGPPIQGVGTATAALIGPAAAGELNEPTKLTSWDQFTQQFGTDPAPGFFLWYAARGFFENGGQVLYVVRASNGANAKGAVLDGDGKAMAEIKLRQPGLLPVVETTVAAKSLIDPALTSVYTASTTYKAAAQARREVEVDDVDPVKAAQKAAMFRPGDAVTVGTAGERVVMRVASGTIRLDADVPAAAGTIRLANVGTAERTIRIAQAAPGTLPADVLVPGTMLTFTQGASADTQVVESVQAEPLQTLLPRTTYRVTLRQPLAFAIDRTGAVATVKSNEFDVTAKQGAASVTFAALASDPQHPRYWIDVINNANGLIVLKPKEPPPTTKMPKNLPATADKLGQGEAGEKEGKAENLGTLSDADYINALDALRRVDDVNMVAIPDASWLPEPKAQAVQTALLDHCQLLADRVAIIDARPGLPLFGATGSIEAQRRLVDSTRGYAALYYPWLRVRSNRPGPPILVPPSGHVCGVIARSDATRGVHKAPANEIVLGALGVERDMSDIEHGQLNMPGINVIRLPAGGGRPILMGARTTATDRNWQYLNIRRLFLYLEESIQEGIRWAVFEPNNHQLWQKLKRSIGDFLNRAWVDGALFGDTAEAAYYVRIDDELNPFSEQSLGRLYIEVGVRPSYPAEFIIVRIGIWQGGGEVSES